MQSLFLSGAASLLLAINPSGDLERKVELMKQEIDTLQVKVAADIKPWYESIPTLLSAAALLFSFGTTFVSYRRTTIQDIQSKRQELRGLLQRLAKLPQENVETMKKYADDPAAMQTISSFINQENTFLVAQAVELAKRLPRQMVSAPEFLAIATALQAAYELAPAEEFLNYASQVAKDFNTKIAVIRATANLKFLTGKPEEGRVDYQKALSIFAAYTNFDDFTKTATNVYTHVAWAYSEANINSFDLAEQQLENAQSLLAKLPPSPGSANLNAQVSQTTHRIQAGRGTPHQGTTIYSPH